MHEGRIKYLIYPRITCGDNSIATKLESIEILRFKHSCDRCLFDITKQIGRRKRLNKDFTVSVVVDLVSGNTI